MITYRDIKREEHTAEKIRYLAGLAKAGDAEGFLVEVGELEQGLVDALRPERDGWSEREMRLRELARIAGEAYLATCEGRSPRDHLQRARAALERVAEMQLPQNIRVKSPEGYVQYALDPAGYATAAEAYAGEVGERRAEKAVVIGVRSIGASLSGVVAAVLGSERSFTVRPRGDTGARHVAADEPMRTLVRGWLREDADVLIVDEGPGATGETFECVARWTREMGAEPRRIVLVPSHVGRIPLATEERQAWFSAARKHSPPYGDRRPARVAARSGLSEPEDLSAGRWRTRVPGAEEEPACTNHERLKYRAHDENGSLVLLRYAGIGRWGTETIGRARRLAELGIGPEVLGYEDGYLLCRWIEGRSVSRDAVDHPGFRAAVADYLSARAGRFCTGKPVNTGPMIELLLQNTREALGPDAPGLSTAVRKIERLPTREAVIADARLQPREWIRHPDGYTKVDAIDHGNGLRFPGPADPAWDLAGAAVEYGLDDDALAELTSRCGASSGEDAEELSNAVAAYWAPYAASCLGEAVLSAREARTNEDRQRLEAEAQRYRERLTRELSR